MITVSLARCARQLAKASHHLNSFACRARAAVAAPGVQFALQAVVRPESGGAVLQGHWRIRDDRGGPQPRAFRMNAEFETETSGTETSDTGKSYHT